ncbi:MAG TPA: hypothetical protein DDW65_17285 [Firmicutes bacterium]|jgi:uncharacterized protein YkwD|nr:hypothetical protein [Bacillota bacterium]
MSRNELMIPTKKLTFACFSVIVTLVILACTPTPVRADNRSNNSSMNFSQEWRTCVETSKAVLGQVLAGQDSYHNPQEAAFSIEENEMVTLINQERAKAGLAELIVDDKLVRLAQEKSQDMVSHNYFGHISEQLGTIYDQLTKERISYQIAAENLAGAPNVLKAENYFIRSPAHRGNILNPHFTRIGVGIVHGGPFGAMFTQLFLD